MRFERVGFYVLSLFDASSLIYSYLLEVLVCASTPILSPFSCATSTLE